MNECSIDVLYQICKYLPLDEFENFFLTSKAWLEVCNSKMLWKEIYETRFSNDLILKKSFEIQRQISKEPSNYKEFVKKILIRKFLPTCRNTICRILKQQKYNSVVSELYKCCYKVTDSLWFERTIYTSEIYKILLESFSESFSNETDEFYTLKLIYLLHEKQCIQFKEFENTFQIIFKVKNQKLSKFIKPMVRKKEIY